MNALTDVLIALTIVIGIGVLIQVGVLLGLLVAALAVRKKVHTVVDHYHKELAPQVVPIVANVRGLVEDLSPKIKAIGADVRGVVADLSPKIKDMGQTVRGVVDDLSPKVKDIGSDAVQISHTVRDEVTRITETVDQVRQRTGQQAARVEDMVSNTLDGVGQATTKVQHGIALPFRRAAQIFRGVRAGVEHLVSKSHDGRGNGIPRNWNEPVGERPLRTGEPGWSESGAATYSDTGVPPVRESFS
jgi:uncharacterized protein YoxC